MSPAKRMVVSASGSFEMMDDAHIARLTPQITEALLSEIRDTDAVYMASGSVVSTMAMSEMHSKHGVNARVYYAEGTVRLLEPGDSRISKWSDRCPEFAAYTTRMRGALRDMIMIDDLASHYGSRLFLYIKHGAGEKAIKNPLLAKAARCGIDTRVVIIDEVAS